MQVSVLTPVYNAEPYLREAVESAVAQDETVEVILVEDGSTDGTRALCEQLEHEYPKVRLLGFTDGREHWIGDKYNLALQHASSEYIAFLEADDYYHPGRFERAQELFESNPEIDGVYEAVEFLFETPRAERLFLESDMNADAMHTFRRHVEPEDLFEEQLPFGTAGWCHANGWTVKRSVFDVIGRIDNVRGWDTIQFMKFAACGRMVAGRLDEPVAVWRLHETNDSFPKPLPEVVHSVQQGLFETMWRWALKRLSVRRRHVVLMRLLAHSAKVVPPPPESRSDGPISSPASSFSV